MLRTDKLLGYFMKLLQSCVLLICVITLAGCASMLSKYPPYNKKLAWSARQKQLKKLKNWTAVGAASIETKKPEKTIQVHVLWKQKNKNYELNLFGPFGVGGTVLTKKPHKVILQDSNGNLHFAKNPESLMQQELGWHMPVSNLIYWVRGLPAPTKIQLQNFDKYHHLVNLRQNNWKIQYLQYSGFNGIDLPTDILLSNPLMKIHLAIRIWEIK